MLQKEFRVSCQSGEQHQGLTPSVGCDLRVAVALARRVVLLDDVQQQSAYAGVDDSKKASFFFIFCKFAR